MGLVYIEKGVHLVVAMMYFALLAASYMAFARFTRASGQAATHHLKFSLSLDYGLLALWCIAVSTGTLLVFSKGYTFNTPWIMAAYFVLVVLVLALLFTCSLKRRYLLTQNVARGLFAWHACYVVQLLLLLVVMHDAVYKMTVWGA